MNSAGFHEIAFLCYVAALLLSLARLRTIALLCMTAGCCCNGVVVVSRYLQALPMMPMHLGIVTLPALLTLIWLYTFFLDKKPGVKKDGVLLQVVIAGLVAVSLFFPKDFYLPFIRSISIWAHLFLLFGIAAKGFLIYSGTLALTYLLDSRAVRAGQEERWVFSIAPSVWGFCLLTLSMFCGEVWSYLGWGTPVVWQDPAITTIIGLWFYWVCLLHLLYLRGWTAGRRAFFTVLGGLLAIVFSVHPDTGPFRLPVFFS